VEVPSWDKEPVSLVLVSFGSVSVSLGSEPVSLVSVSVPSSGTPVGVERPPAGVGAHCVG
jgi:hypothetical protein